MKIKFDTLFDYDTNGNVVAKQNIILNDDKILIGEIVKSEFSTKEHDKLTFVTSKLNNGFVKIEQAIDF